MATFTSVTSGNWNDGATWGNASPGVKGVDWPGNFGDVVNIGTTANQSHVVIYNVSETNQLGQVTIGASSGSGASRLEFSRSMNTKLSMGYQDIRIQATGELRVGTSGAVIPKDYVAEIIWNTFLDGNKGLNLPHATGTISVYGDPTYYGSLSHSTLYQAWSAPASGDSTIYVAGDLSGKWAVGFQLALHKGTDYASYGTDFCVVAIRDTVTFDGVKSTVPVTLYSIPGGVGTFTSGGFVICLARNVQLKKSNAALGAGDQNGSRPIINNATTYGNGTISFNDTVFIGFFQISAGYNCSANNVVARNGYFGVGPSIYGTFSGIVLFSYRGVSNPRFANIDMLIGGCSRAAIEGLCWGSISGALFGSLAGLYYVNNAEVSACVFSNGSGFKSSQVIHLTGYLKRPDGATANNTEDINNDFALNNAYKFKNVAPPPVMSNRSSLISLGSENHGDVMGAHVLYGGYGEAAKVPADGTDDNPAPRSGGNAEVVEVIPQSGCDPVLYFEFINCRVWAEANVSKTYRFFVQSTYATLPSAELQLYGEYLDEGSGGRLATAASEQGIATRTDAADWSQYVEVTLNPAQTGYVNLYLRLMGYESGQKVWVDPKVVISGGDAVTVTPRWSYGEVQLDLDPAATSGPAPAQPGLAPLGIKQVTV
jgi:hypothetical protein